MNEPTKTIISLALLKERHVVLAKATTDLENNVRILRAQADQMERDRIATAGAKTYIEQLIQEAEKKA